MKYSATPNAVFRLMDIARQHGKNVALTFNCFPDPDATTLGLLQGIAAARQNQTCCWYIRLSSSTPKLFFFLFSV